MGRFNVKINNFLAPINISNQNHTSNINSDNQSYLSKSKQSAKPESLNHFIDIKNNTLEFTQAKEAYISNSITPN